MSLLGGLDCSSYGREGYLQHIIYLVEAELLFMNIVEVVRDLEDFYSFIRDLQISIVNTC